MGEEKVRSPILLPSSTYGPLGDWFFGSEPPSTGYQPLCPNNALRRRTSCRRSCLPPRWTLRCPPRLSKQALGRRVGSTAPWRGLLEMTGWCQIHPSMPTCRIQMPAYRPSSAARSRRRGQPLQILTRQVLVGLSFPTSRSLLPPLQLIQRMSIVVSLRRSHQEVAHGCDDSYAAP